MLNCRDNISIYADNIETEQILLDMDKNIAQRKVPNIDLHELNIAYDLLNNINYELNWQPNGFIKKSIKRVICKLVGVYVNPILERQNYFNLVVSRSLKEAEEKLKKLEESLTI